MFDRIAGMGRAGYVETELGVGTQAVLKLDEARVQLRKTQSRFKHVFQSVLTVSHSLLRVDTVRIFD